MRERLYMEPSLNLPIDLQQAEQHLVPAELLDELKTQLHERSKAEGEIVELGTLSGGQNEHLWNQGEKAISLRRRIDKGEITEAYVESQLAALDEYFVPTTPGAPKVCVDGSSVLGYDDNDPASFWRPFGPQIQGGSGDEAVAQRVNRGFGPDDQDVNFISDLKKVTDNRPRRSRFSEGGHTDDQANADVDDKAEKSGCGAVDGQPRKIPRYSDPEAAPVIRGTADAIYDVAGLQHEQDAYDKFARGVAELAKRPEYFDCSPHDVSVTFQELNDKGLEKMVRPHNEVAVVINLVPNSRFHRDHFNARTDSTIQVFGLDAWNIIEEYGPDEGYPLVSDAVATLMDLTDGTLKLLIRRPRASGQQAA